MSFNLHTSERLVSLFRERPWQGKNPFKSDFVFVGLDANYESKGVGDGLSICDLKIPNGLEKGLEREGKGQPLTLDKEGQAYALHKSQKHFCGGKQGHIPFFPWQDR